MTPITVTATARVAAERAFARLTTPRHIAAHLNGVLPAVYAYLDRPSGRAAPALRGRWSFHAEPRARRIHWQLIDPIHLAGVLDVRGAGGRTRLSLTVQQVPQCWPRDRIWALARTVLVQLRDRLAAELPRSTPQPAHLITDGSAEQKRAIPAPSKAATICAAHAKQAPVDPPPGTREGSASHGARAAAAGQHDLAGPITERLFAQFDAANPDPDRAGLYLPPTQRRATDQW